MFGSMLHVSSHVESKALDMHPHRVHMTVLDVISVNTSSRHRSLAYFYVKRGVSLVKDLHLHFNIGLHTQEK